MKLPTGASGVGPVPDTQSVALKAFSGICYRAAHRTNGSVTSITPAGVTPNFHTAVVTYSRQQIAVLRHSTLPLVALAEPLSTSDVVLNFVDHPTLAAAIADSSDLEVLAADQLHTPLSQADITDLTRDEQRQVEYWKPETVGDLLFNFWD